MSELDDAIALVVARLAHDLKNPLAVILSNLRYLSMSITSAEEVEAIEESLVSADRLDRILADVVDLKRLDRAESASVGVAITELEPALREKLRLQLGRRTLEVQLVAAELRVDHGLLGRVLLNLLEHAVRNTPTTGTVVLRAEVADGELVLEVVDGGPPFAPDGVPSFLSEGLTSRAAPASGFRSDQGLGPHFAGVAARALGARTELLERDDGPGVVFRLIFPADLLS